MRYLGIDFGLRRIGLATSDGEMAAPLKVLEVKGFKDAVQKVIDLCRRERFKKNIVGLPEGKMGQLVLRFVAALRKNGLNVTTSDETLSSQKAIERLIELGIPKQKRRIADDAAAAIILQNWLDENRGSPD